MASTAVRTREHARESPGRVQSTSELCDACAQTQARARGTTDDAAQPRTRHARDRAPPSPRLVSAGVRVAHQCVCPRRCACARACVAPVCVRVCVRARARVCACSRARLRACAPPTTTLAATALAAAALAVAALAAAAALCRHRITLYPFHHCGHL